VPGTLPSQRPAPLTPSSGDLLLPWLRGPPAVGADAASPTPTPQLAQGATVQEQVMYTMMQTQAALSDKLKGRKSPEGEDAIGGLPSGGADEDGGDAGLKLPGAKGAAARAAFRTEVRRRPLHVARTIYRNFASAMSWEPLASQGSSSVPDRASMRSHFTQRVAFGSYKTLAHLGFSIATAWDWLMAGEDGSLDHVKALLGLTCAAIEQVTLDSGNWTLAQQYMCLPEPPWGYISRSASGQPRTLFTELADPRWSAAITGYLKDVDPLKAQRRPGGQEDDQPPPKRQPKGGGRDADKKGAGRGAGAAGAEAP